MLPLDHALTVSKYANLSGYKILKITDYVETYSYIVEKYSNYPVQKQEYNDAILSMIYYFNCNCYLTSLKDDNFWFKIDNKEVKFYIDGKMKNTTQNYEKNKYIKKSCGI